MTAYRAILIGNGEFTPGSGLPDLSGPSRDVRRLASALAEPDGGFHRREDILSLINRSKQEILTALNQCATETASSQQLLVYFSGHGQLNIYNELYLCARDTRADVLPATGIWAKEFNNILKESRARAIVLILDCCHSGAYELKGGDVERSFAVFQQVEDPPNGRFLLSSTGSEELSKDGPEGSVFTELVINALRSSAGDFDKDGLISLEDVYHYTRQKLKAANLPSPILTVIKGGSYPPLGSVPRNDVVRPQVLRTKPLPQERQPQESAAPVALPSEHLIVPPKSLLPELTKKSLGESAQLLEDLLARSGGAGSFGHIVERSSRAMAGGAMRGTFTVLRAEPPLPGPLLPGPLLPGPLLPGPLLPGPLLPGPLLPGPLLPGPLLPGPLLPRPILLASQESKLKEAIGVLVLLAVIASMIFGIDALPSLVSPQDQKDGQPVLDRLRNAAGSAVEPTRLEKIRQQMETRFRSDPMK